MEKMIVMMMEDTATSDNDALSQYNADGVFPYRQAEEEPLQGVPRNCQDQGSQQGQEEVNGPRRGYWCNGFGYALLAFCIWCSGLYLHDLVWEKHRLGVDDAEISRAMRFCHQLLLSVAVTMYNSTHHDRGSDLMTKSKNDNPDAPIQVLSGRSMSLQVMFTRSARLPDWDRDLLPGIGSHHPFERLAEWPNDRSFAHPELVQPLGECLVHVVGFLPRELWGALPCATFTLLHLYISSTA